MHITLDCMNNGITGLIKQVHHSSYRANRYEIRFFCVMFELGYVRKVRHR